MFPEGTRIAPGKVGRYKLGGALLATRTNTPIIPVAHNAGECWRRKAFIKKPGLVTVSIGPLIDPTGLTPDAVNEKVRDLTESELRVLNRSEERSVGKESVRTGRSRWSAYP